MMRPCSLVQIDQPARDFVALARVALGVVEALDESHPAHSQLLNALEAGFRALDTREPFGERFYNSAPAALDRLRQEIEATGPPLDATLTAAGHTHIDVAWLWTLDQTRRQAGRTFHMAARLMEQFPDYHFS